MKIGFYSPYLDALGGGERYILQMASLLSVQYEVVIFGPQTLREIASERFGLDLAKVKFIPSFFNANTIVKIIKTTEFDVLFYVTDGSLFISGARKNILVVQVPQKSMYHTDAFTKFKLGFWKTQLVYSGFVKKYIDLWWGTQAVVFPPAVDIPQLKPNRKENIILTVGRFFPSPHTKRQDALIDAFKNLKLQGLKGWKLILAGGVDEQGKDYLNRMKKMITDDSIEILTNITNKELTDIYKKAKLYWHAAGYEGDVNNHPERAEHFGITTLEAMSYNAVPLVFPAGGQLEIIEDNINGLFWQTKNELCEKTIQLINDKYLLNKLSAGAYKRSQDFNVKIFENKLNKLLRD